MRLPNLQSGIVRMGVNNANATSLVPQCDRERDCTVRKSVRYPCPTLSNPGRMCDKEISWDDPVCLAERALCRDVWGAMENKAIALAQAWQQDNPDRNPGSDSDYNDCVTVVAAGLATAGAVVGAGAGGPVGAGLGAALGAGSGVPLGRMACRRLV